MKHMKTRRSDRENLSAFAALIATPHDLGAGALTTPAPGRLALSHSAGLSSGQVTVAVGSRRGFSHPALDADQVHRGYHAEKGVEVTQTGAPTGTLSVYLVNPFDGTYDLIATEVV
jgi:hypothetical protein